MRKPTAKRQKKAARQQRPARHSRRARTGKPAGAKKPAAPEEKIIAVAAFEQEPQFFEAEGEEPEVVGIVQVDEWRL